ncbi:hypothetical protein Tco_0337997 [Tanacetum coccineum]
MCSGGGQRRFAIVDRRRQSSLAGSPAVVDHRWPPLTGGLVVAPVTAGKPCGTTQVYEVAAVGQSEHDTCPKRVIQGCQACVSPRLACGDTRL